MISGLRIFMTRARSANGNHSFVGERGNIHTNRKNKQPSLQRSKQDSNHSHLTGHPHPTIQPQHHPIQHDILNTLRNELCELVRLARTHCFSSAILDVQYRSWGIQMGLGGKNSQGNSITLVKLARTLSLIIAVIRESNILGATVTTRMP